MSIIIMIVGIVTIAIGIALTYKWLGYMSKVENPGDVLQYVWLMLDSCLCAGGCLLIVMGVIMII